jgi:hypothetical protein
MKARLVAVGVVVVLCLVLPSLVVPSVSASSASVSRRYLIKSIYYVRHTFLNPDVVMEMYFCPETKAFKWHRGAFEQYDAYTNYIALGGKWIEIRIYWK